MIKEGVLGSVKARGGHFGGYRHANSITDALAKRASGRFHPARCMRQFWVARRLGMELPESLDLLKTHIGVTA